MSGFLRTPTARYSVRDLRLAAHPGGSFPVEVIGRLVIPARAAASGAPEDPGFYAALINPSRPLELLAGNPAKALQDGQFQASDFRYYIDDTGIDVLQETPVWWVLWRNLALQPGTTLTIPLRPLRVGDGTEAGSVPQGWTHPTLCYNSSGTPIVNGYGPHPMTHGGFTLIAQTIALPSDLASVQALGGWNALSHQPVDGFNRADGASLGSNWTIISNSPKIVSGQALSSVLGGGGSVAWWQATTFSTLDQFSRVRLAAFTGGAPYREIEQFLRMQASGTTFYEIGWYNDGGGDRYYVARVTAGTPVVLADAAIGANVGSLDLLEARAIGTTTTTITLYRNNVQVASVVDTSGLLQPGAPGFGLYVEGALTDITVENWQGGSLDGPPGTVMAEQVFAPGLVSALPDWDLPVTWPVGHGLLLRIADHPDPEPAVQTYPSGPSFAGFYSRAGAMVLS